MKKDMIRNIIYRGLLAAMALLAVSCTKEPVGEILPGKSREGLFFKIATRAAEGDVETNIDKVAVLIFDKTTQRLVTAHQTTLTYDDDYDQTESCWIVDNIVCKDPTPSKVIYAIANWNDAPTFTVGSYTINDLEAALSTYATYAAVTANGILMSGKTEVTTLDMPIADDLEITVKRAVAKLSFELSMKPITESNNYPVIWHKDGITFKVRNASSKVYVTNQTGTPTPLTDFIPGAAPSFIVPYDAAASTTNTVWNLTASCYLPENLNLEGKATFLVLKVPYHYTDDPAGTTRYTYYRIFLSDDNLPTKVVRNTHYTLRVELLGKGAELPEYVDGSSVRVDVTAKEWIPVTSTEQGGGYIRATSASVGSGTNISEDGETIEIECTTNSPGRWYIAIIGDDNNNEISERIYTEIGNTGYFDKPADNKVSITIPKLNGYEPYTHVEIRLYHEDLYPFKEGIPFYAIRYTQYAGFIPNWILKNEGWVDNLPSNYGLFLSKRGNALSQDSPSPPNADDRSDIIWKTTRTNSPGTDGLNLGTGIINTQNMITVIHPLADYCRSISDGKYYMPSYYELKLISDNNATYGYSYGFGYDKIYWSSTETTDGKSALVAYIYPQDFYDAFWAKTNINSSVRCIRNDRPANASAIETYKIVDGKKVPYPAIP